MGDDSTADNQPTDNTERLLNHFKKDSTVEVDHALKLYLGPGKRFTWRDTETIRENGYKIQDIENKEVQTKITLVRCLDTETEYGGVQD